MSAVEPAGVADLEPVSGLATDRGTAILARILDVAVDRQHLASGDWTSYAAEISCRAKSDAVQ